MSEAPNPKPLTEEELRQRVENLLRNPKNLGELAGADAVGTVGSAGCGDLMRIWLKFREQNGKKVVDQATFQSFGCETAIAAASLATEMIRGRTVEEALSMSAETLTAELGPLPPTKVHCSQLVEGALRSALEAGPRPTAASAAAASEAASAAPATEEGNTQSLYDRLVRNSQSPGKVRIVLLDSEKQKAEES